MTDTPSPNGQRNRIQNTPADDPVRVPPPVYAQFEALRHSGTVNMYTEVVEGLERFEFDAARTWLAANPEAYTDGLSRGFKPTDPDAVEPIDPATLRAAVPDTPPKQDRSDASTPTEQRVLDHLESVSRLSAAAATYYAEGTWRTTAPLTPAEHDHADRFADAVECQPKQCYRNAQLVATTFGETVDVQYVEGYVLAAPLTAPIQHAWVELDGTVLELTFPDGPEPDTDAAYLGIDFSTDVVHEHLVETRASEPLASTLTEQPENRLNQS